MSFPEILYRCSICGWAGREPHEETKILPGMGPVQERTCPGGHWVGREWGIK